MKRNCHSCKFRGGLLVRRNDPKLHEDRRKEAAKTVKEQLLGGNKPECFCVAHNKYVPNKYVCDQYVEK